MYSMSQTAYDDLLALYREHGPKHKLIEEIMRERGEKITRRALTRGYKDGWPSKKLPSILETIKADQVAARAAVKEDAEPEPGPQEKARRAAEKRREELREKATQQAVETLKHEAELTGNMRNNARLASALVTNVAAALLKKQPAIMEKIGQIESMSPKEVVRLIKDLGHMARMTNDAAEIAIRTERIRLGKPIDLADLDTGIPQLEGEERRQKVERANRLMAKAKERGIHLVPKPAEASGK